MASSDELACVYAALILADDQVAITSDKIATILKAAGVSVEPYWPSLFSKALDGVNVKEMISNISSGASYVNPNAIEFQFTNSTCVDNVHVSITINLKHPNLSFHVYCSGK